MKMYNPPHPGELLNEWFTNLNVPAPKMAARIGLPTQILLNLVQCQCAFTAAIDLQLHDALGTEKGFWLKLQQNYDEWQAENRFGK